MLLGKFISTKSLMIKRSQPNKNYKGDIIKCGRYNEDICKSYIYFDLSSLPEDIYIISAKLYLNLLNRLNPSSLYTINIYPLLDDFGDFTTYNFQPKVLEIPISYNLIYKRKGKIELNITDVVLRWRSGLLINKGLLIKGEESKLDMLIFGSAYNNEYNNIPSIEIAYSIESPTPSGQNFVKYYDYEEIINYINGTVKSQIIDFSHLIQATVFVNNIGNYDVTVTSQYSPNNEIWIQDFSKKIAAGTTSYIIPKIYSKYYRLLIQSTGNGVLKMYISYIVYLWH